MIRAVIVIVAAVVVASSSARAGVCMDHEAVLPNPADLTKSIKQTLHSCLQGKKYKRDSPLRNETVIIDLDKGEVYGVNGAKRTYWKMKADKYQQLALVSLVVMGVQVDPKTGQPIVPDPLFAETGAKATIDRWPSFEVKVAATLPPGVQTTIWVSKDVNLPADVLVNTMRLSLGNPKGAAYEQLFQQWAQLKGYPVQNVTTVKTGSGVITTSETLLTYVEKDVPATEFQVPKGYALVTDPMTELEQKAAQAAAGPVGIGAPLKPR